MTLDTSGEGNCEGGPTLARGLLDCSLSSVLFSNPLQGSNKSDLSPVSCSHVLRDVPVCHLRHCAPHQPSPALATPGSVSPLSPVSGWSSARARSQSGPRHRLMIWRLQEPDSVSRLYPDPPPSHHTGAGWSPAVARSVASYINTQADGAGDHCRKR